MISAKKSSFVKEWQRKAEEGKGRSRKFKWCHEKIPNEKGSNEKSPISNISQLGGPLSSKKKEN